MDPIYIRYGESLTLPIDTGDVLAATADIYIGKPGEVYVLTDHITLTDGEGTFEFTPLQTQIPIGTYYYQVNVNDASGDIVDKYPAPESDCNGCDDVDFPEFVVGEALDLTEVS